MFAYWDFRSILDVYPENSKFTCVGTTKKGVRCTQRMFSRMDSSYASSILDEMDADKKLSSSYKYLEELAELTLCPRWHRKPGYSQVRSIAMRWQIEIANYAAEVERKQREKSALEASRKASLPSAPSSPLDSNAALPGDSGRDQSPPATPSKAPKATCSSKTFTITKTSSIKVTASAEYSEFTPRVVTQGKMKMDGVELPPTPDATPEPLKKKTASKVTLLTYEFGAGKQVPIPTFDLGITTKDFSQEKPKIEEFKFELPPTPDTTPEPRAKHESTNKGARFAYEFGAGNQAPLPAFDLGISTRLPTSIPLAGEWTPARDDNKCFRTNEKVLPFDFIPGYKVPSTSFDFSTPIIYPSIEKEPFVSSLKDSSKQSTTPRKSAPIPTNISLISPEGTPDPPEYDSHDLEESYGYAIVITSSTCYKSYLPSPQQYGFAIPPETTKSRRHELQDPFLAFIPDFPSSGAAILRKPLPNPPSLLANDRDEVACDVCGVGENDCRYDADSATERVGCFHSMRLRRLSKSVVRKLSGVKKRTFR